MDLPLRWFDDGGTDSDNDEDDNNIVFYAEFIFCSPGSLWYSGMVTLEEQFC